MLTINLNEEAARDTSVVGGKAASLAHLHALNVPSPAGFCVTVAAYQEHLKLVFLALPSLAYHLTAWNAEDLRRVRESIIAYPLAETVRQAVAHSLAELERGAHDTPLRVAVRSSAVAEDSREASFAGQYDTYLNIVGEEAVCSALVRCWASFWNERAYFYRTRHRHPSLGASGMAVVINELIPADAAGTMFTAHPVTQEKGMHVIEASWGLGELLVSGRVTPDTYYVDTRAGEPLLTKKLIKAKRLMLLPSVRGSSGTQEVAVHASQMRQQVLSDAQILHLSRLGQDLVRRFGYHLDIEWALRGTELAILQSRPITTLLASQSQ